MPAAHSDECCLTHELNANLSCFKSSPSPQLHSSQRCLSRHSFLNGGSEVRTQRCYEAIDCESTHVCARLRADEEILRLKLWIPSHLLVDVPEHERKVVWSGPRYEVLEDGTCPQVCITRISADVELVQLMLARMLPGMAFCRCGYPQFSVLFSSTYPFVFSYFVLTL